jgi:hypothetical protein
MTYDDNDDYCGTRRALALIKVIMMAQLAVGGAWESARTGCCWLGGVMQLAQNSRHQNRRWTDLPMG